MLLATYVCSDEDMFALSCSSLMARLMTVRCARSLAGRCLKIGGSAGRCGGCGSLEEEDMMVECFPSTFLGIIAPPCTKMRSVIQGPIIER